MSERNRILVIAPHADDEVLGCGGAIQRHVAEGDRVSVLIVSNRVLNHVEDPTYIAETKTIARDVARLLGIDDVRFGELRDEQLDQRLIDVIIPIEDAVQRAQPDVVYVPNGDDSDQDHRAVAAACRVACRSVDAVLAYEVPGPTRHFRPNYYVAIDAFLERKIAAMQMYEGELRPYPHPRSPEGLRIHAQARGLESHLAAAEAFTIERRIRRSSDLRWP